MVEWLLGVVLTFFGLVAAAQRAWRSSSRVRLRASIHAVTTDDGYITYLERGHTGYARYLTCTLWRPQTYIKFL